MMDCGVRFIIDVSGCHKRSWFWVFFILSPALLLDISYIQFLVSLLKKIRLLIKFLLFFSIRFGITLLLLVFDIPVSWIVGEFRIAVGILRFSRLHGFLLIGDCCVKETSCHMKVSLKFTKLLDWVSQLSSLLGKAVGCWELSNEPHIVGVGFVYSRDNGCVTRHAHAHAYFRYVQTMCIPPPLL